MGLVKSLFNLNVIIKNFITDYKKEYLYGDCHLGGTIYYYPLIGVVIKVKLFGLFWITYA